MATNNEKVESIKEKKISSINKSADNKFLSAMDSFQEGIKKLEDTFDIVKEL